MHATDTADPVEAVRELTGGGAHCAFESVGSEQVLAQAYAATRRGGTTVAIGLPHPSKRLAVPAVTVVAEERTIKGSYMGSAVLGLMVNIRQVVMKGHGKVVLCGMSDRLMRIFETCCTSSPPRSNWSAPSARCKFQRQD